MAKNKWKLSKDELENISGVREEVEKAIANLRDDVFAEFAENHEGEEAGKALTEAFKDAMEKPIEAVNSAAQSLKDAFQDIYDRIQGDRDEMSDRWQESEKADAVNAWLDSIQEAIDTLDTEIELPEEYDPTLGHEQIELGEIENNLEIPEQPD